MPKTTTTQLTIQHFAQQAMVAEVLAPKAGNVHCFADFEDTTWTDFVVSAMVSSPILEQAAKQGIGQTIYQAVQATHDAVQNNTNLGILLLLTPLCAASLSQDLKGSIIPVLASLTSDDARLVYQAIRLANPGGLGNMKQNDIQDTPPDDLLKAMQFAAKHDAVARQYTNNFADIFERLLPYLLKQIAQGAALDQAITQTHLHQMAHEPDSLIMRKCGLEIAKKSQFKAQAVLAGKLSFAAFDQWLRADQHRRNPGTSADLIAATLFAGFRDKLIAFPANWQNALVLA